MTIGSTSPLLAPSGLNWNLYFSIVVVIQFSISILPRRVPFFVRTTASSVKQLRIDFTSWALLAAM